MVLTQWVSRKGYWGIDYGTISVLRPSPFSSLPTDEAAPWCFHLGVVTCLPTGLCFDIRPCFWHQFEDMILTLAFWTHKACGLLQKRSRPKMMSCSFERLQFLEYYQELKKKKERKKVIFLEFSLPSRCPDTTHASQAAWAALGASRSFSWLCFDFPFLYHGKNSCPQEPLMPSTLLDPSDTSMISSRDLKCRAIKDAKV